MNSVARKRFFGVHAPDPSACVHVDTEANASLLNLDCESLEIFQSVQEDFQCSNETYTLIHLCSYMAFLLLLTYANIRFSHDATCI